MPPSALSPSSAQTQSFTRWVAASLAAFVPLSTFAQESPDPELFARPAFQLLRQNEDWSGLAGRDRTATGDFFDPAKFIPLSDDESIWASFGMRWRSRVEAWDNFNFGGPGDRSDIFWLNRFEFHGDLHAGENLRLFVEGKSALSTDRSLPGGTSTPALFVDELDLQQAFVDVTLPLGDIGEVTFRPGRQEFLFGKQRLVSPLHWSNTLRTWDGVSLPSRLFGWSITPFWSQYVSPIRKYDFNQADAGTQFFGVYATGKPELLYGMGMDLYYLGLKSDATTFRVAGNTGHDERHTVGGRLFGDVFDTGLDYDVEGAYQFGSFRPGGASNDIDAFMVAAEVGYKPRDVWGEPRFFIGFDFASGDDSSTGTMETFNQLFPLGHAYLGYIDVVGRQNILDASGGVSLTPLKKTTVRLAGHGLFRANKGDGLYNAGGAIVREPGTSDERFIGVELDLTIQYQVNRHLLAEFGYSHFFAGDFIEDTGPDDDIDFFYFQLQYTF